MKVWKAFQDSTFLLYTVIVSLIYSFACFFSWYLFPILYAKRISTILLENKRLSKK